MLDTFPFNAGTTASDALWMGTPMVTRAGRTYISRMAGSLLNAVDLPQIVRDIVMPGREAVACTATEAELMAEYTGIALVATPLPTSVTAPGGANRHGQEATLMRHPGSHWLWRTVRRFVPYYRGALLAALLSNVLMLVTGLATSVEIRTGQRSVLDFLLRPMMKSQEAFTER